MPTVVLTRALAQQTDGALRHQVDATTVHDALEHVFDKHPLLRRYLLTDTGIVRPHVNVFLNDGPVRDRQTLADHCLENDEIQVLQAVSGGSNPSVSTSAPRPSFAPAHPRGPNLRHESDSQRPASVPTPDGRSPADIGWAGG